MITETKVTYHIVDTAIPGCKFMLTNTPGGYILALQLVEKVVETGDILSSVRSGTGVVRIFTVLRNSIALLLDNEVRIYDINETTKKIKPCFGLQLSDYASKDVIKMVLSDKRVFLLHPSGCNTVSTGIVGADVGLHVDNDISGIKDIIYDQDSKKFLVHWNATQIKVCEYEKKLLTVGYLSCDPGSPIIQTPNGIVYLYKGILRRFNGKESEKIKIDHDIKSIKGSLGGIEATFFNDIVKTFKLEKVIKQVEDYKLVTI